MKIEFNDKRLRSRLSTLGEARRFFGDTRSRIIFRRIGQIEVAQDEEELLFLPGKFHRLTGDRDGQWACSLDANWRLIFRVKRENDYIAVIIEVVDYH